MEFVLSNQRRMPKHVPWSEATVIAILQATTQLLEEDGVQARHNQPRRQARGREHRHALSVLPDKQALLDAIPVTTSGAIPGRHAQT